MYVRYVIIHIIYVYNMCIICIIIIFLYIYIYAIVAILFLNRKEKLLGREPLQSSKLLLLTHSEPPYHLYR